LNLNTITIPKEVALEKLAEYRQVAIQNRRAEDIDFRRLYRAAKSGRPILDVAAALKETGVNEKAHPLLALARAHWTTVYYSSWHKTFSCVEDWHRRSKQKDICLPKEIGWPIGTRLVSSVSLKTAVPFIPPAIRPQDNLEKYHILFEVPNWEEYSADPFLLKHIAGWLFMVCGEWELTDLERSLLTR